MSTIAIHRAYPSLSIDSGVLSNRQHSPHQLERAAVRSLEQRAACLLECHPHFRGRSQWINFRCANRVLEVRGKLPSFYLKQLVQELLRNLEGVDRIDNRIEVASPVGELGVCQACHNPQLACRHFL